MTLQPTTKKIMVTSNLTLLESPDIQFGEVRLDPTVSYGTVKINGNERNVDEAYINSSEVANALVECLALVGEGLLASIKAFYALERIQNEKLYLRFRDADGSPRFSSFGAFLQETQNINRTQFGQMRKTVEGYRWLVDNHGEEYVKSLRQSRYIFRELGTIEPGDRNKALEAIVARSGKDGLTGDALKQWRQNHELEKKSLPEAVSSTASADEIQKELQELFPDSFTTSSDGATPLVQATPQAPAVSEMITMANSVSDDVQVDQVDTVAEVRASSCQDEDDMPFNLSSLEHTAQTQTLQIDMDTTQAITDTTLPLQNPDYPVTTNEKVAMLIKILGDAEFIQGIAMDAIGHSDRGNLKDGERPLRCQINDAISAFQTAVNRCQLDARLKPMA